MPVGGRNGCCPRSRERVGHEPSVVDAQEDLRRRALFTTSARVLITRVNPGLPATGFHTGAPSIGTRIAGDVLTSTRGGVLDTATGGGAAPIAASEACRRSSETVANAFAAAADSGATSDAPRSGSDGMSTFATVMFVRPTERDTLSTCVTAVASSVPYVSLPAPLR